MTGIRCQQNTLEDGRRCHDDSSKRIRICSDALPIHIDWTKPEGGGGPNYIGRM
jgi:hypothetical protein